MKRYVSFMLITIMLFSIILPSATTMTVSASGNLSLADGIIYKLNDDGNSYTVVQYVGDAEKVVIPSLYKKLPVTIIGNSAFNGCEEITDVVIPNTVVTLDSYAFAGCNKLDNITIPDSVTTIENDVFNSCVSLKNITIPQSVTYMGSGVFYGCVSLETFAFPSNIVEIHDSTFFHCENLTEVSLPEQLQYIYGDAFNGCLKLEIIDFPDSLLQIMRTAFSGTAIKELNIPKNVRYLAFDNCTKIEKINVDPENKTYYSIDNCLINSSTGALVLACKNSVIPNDGSVTSIYSEAFSSYPKVLEIPDSVISIEEGAFSGDAENLEHISLGSGIAAWGSYIAYCDFPNLKSISVSDNNPTYISVNNCLIEADTGTLVLGCNGSVIPDDGSVTSIAADAFKNASIENLTIPDTVTSIAGFAFRSCAIKNIHLGSAVVLDSSASFFCSTSSLESISVSEDNSKYNVSNNCLIETENNKLLIFGLNGSIPEDGSVKTIDYYTFYGRTDIIELKIPDGVTYVGSLSGCTSLKSITLPDSLTALPSFWNCTSLESITIPNSVTSLDLSEFIDCASLTGITIPASVTSITGSFMRCANLNSINIDSNNETYNAVNNCIIETQTGTIVAGCDNSVIPTDGSIKVIGPQAFRCANIKTINIPDSVVTIEEFAFDSCELLESINIPSSVKSIGRFAFSECKSLKIIKIPASVAEMDEYVFDTCSNLTDIYCEAEYRPETWNINWNQDWNPEYEEYEDDDCNAKVHWNCNKISVDDVVNGSIDRNAEIRGNHIDKNKFDEGFYIEFNRGSAEIYDIYLEKDGNVLQPYGEVRVSIAAPEGIDISKAKVWHIAEDGTTTDMNAVYENGYFIFITDHFSYYMVAETANESNDEAIYALGDINANGGIDMTDYILSKRAYFGTYTLSEQEFKRGDINKNNEIDMTDYILIKRAYFGTYTIE